MNVTVVVGNPKPRSLTYQAALLVAERLTDAPPDLAVDLVDLGVALLDWSDPTVAQTVAAVRASDLVIVASPTYKATFTGLLKLFLDRIGGGALAGVTAVPLMLGGDWRHSLAPEVFLKPVLAELGASCPTRDCSCWSTTMPSPMRRPPGWTRPAPRSTAWSAPRPEHGPAALGGKPDRAEFESVEPARRRWPATPR